MAQEKPTSSSVVSIYRATRPTSLFNADSFLPRRAAGSQGQIEERSATAAMDKPEQLGVWGVDSGIDFFLQPVKRLPIFSDAVGENTPDLGSTWSHGIPSQEGESNSSAMADIRRTAEVGFGRRRKGHSPDSEGPEDSQESTGVLNPEAPGWIKRVRTASLPPDRTPCATRVGAFEQSIRGFAERKSEVVVYPETGLTFNSIGEAYDFYNLYSWEYGFHIRSVLRVETCQRSRGKNLGVVSVV